MGIQCVHKAGAGVCCCMMWMYTLYRLCAIAWVVVLMLLSGNLLSHICVTVF